MNDILIKAIANDAPVKITAIYARKTVQRARDIHKTFPVVTAALGRTLMATSILASELKNENGSITIAIKGDGPIGTILCVSDIHGNPRGYAQNPYVDIERREDKKLNVGEAVGKGYLSVRKDIGMKEPFNGTSELISGEIAEDINAYLVQSEQIPSAVALGVLVDCDLSVKQAGGYIISLMPGHTIEHIELIEKSVKNAGNITNMLESGMTLVDIINKVLCDFDMKILEKRDIEYKCFCSEKKVLGVLLSIGEIELTKIIETDEKVELTCQFCDEIYTYSSDEIKEILKNAKKIKKTIDK